MTSKKMSDWWCFGRSYFGLESIIVQFFKAHWFGVSLALGLTAGKLTPFISARISLPLTEHFGPYAPLNSLMVQKNHSYASA
ncbi:hypothetical protein EDB19DRAFT_1762277 [Suillus lakei]|nr:hypothetical protein EDB19DRAFT_1762277 [Suillus lakei]